MTAHHYHYMWNARYGVKHAFFRISSNEFKSLPQPEAARYSGSSGQHENQRGSLCYSFATQYSYFRSDNLIFFMPLLAVRSQCSSVSVNVQLKVVSAISVGCFCQCQNLETHYASCVPLFYKSCAEYFCHCYISKTAFFFFGFVPFCLSQQWASSTHGKMALCKVVCLPL